MVVVGADTRFGVRNSGNVETLRTLGVDLGFDVVAVDDIGHNGRWSSTRVRSLMADVLLEPADFREESIGWAAKVISGEITVTRPEIDRDEASWEAAIAASKMLVDAKTGGFAPAPYRCLLYTSRCV